MSKQIDLFFVPDGCSPECPLLHTSQAAALSMAAQAQSLFQGFLKSLDKIRPGMDMAPESKKGANMMEYFTCKLDQAFVNLYLESDGIIADKLQCETCPFASVCHSSQAASAPKPEAVDKELYENAIVYNAQLQSQCNDLETQVQQLLGELSKRRTQYNNRLLIQIFEDQYNINYPDDEGSFFDIVPRDRLSEFIPFIRNIVLGPAIASQFDEQVEQILESYKDTHGHIPVGDWEKVMDNRRIRKILDQISAMFYERSQHKESFRMLIHRKSPVAPQKFAQLLELFASLGVQHELDMAG